MRADDRDAFLVAFEVNGNNRAQTAMQLRIGAATLYRKLKSHGLIGRKHAVGKARSSALGSGSATPFKPTGPCLDLD
jgi:hypothetical protein